MWSIKKTYQRYVLPAGILIVLLGMGAVEPDTDAQYTMLIYFVMSFFMVAALYSAKRDKEQLIMETWWEKTGYVISVGVCGLFVIGFAAGIFLAATNKS